MPDTRPHKVMLFTGSSYSGTQTEEDVNEALENLSKDEAEILSVTHSALALNEQPNVVVMIVYRDKHPKGVGGTARSF